MGRTYVIGLSLVFVIGPVLAGDWPEWRGPDRNGIAPDSPPLAETWPANGPKKLWESEAIRSSNEGGWGSVVVAEGKVFVLVFRKYSEPVKERTLPDRALRQFGIPPDQTPADIVKAVEEARLSAERAAITDGRALRDWCAKWIEEHFPDPQQRRRFGDWAHNRLRLGKEGLPLETIEKLASIENKPFPSEEELLKWLDENEIRDQARAQVLRFVVRDRPLASDVVLCLDAATGKTVWKSDLPGTPHQTALSSTPCVANGRCYVAGSAGTVYCLDVKDGKEIWRAKGKVNPNDDVSSSVAVVEGIVVAQVGPLMGFRADNGEQLWAVERYKARYSSPSFWRKDGKTYVIGNTERTAFCVDLKTGAVLWEAPGGMWSSPTVVGDRAVIYTASANPGLVAYNISLTGAERLWSVKCSDRGASVVVHGGYVYAFGGRGDAHARCIKLDTGEVAWDERIESTEISSPVAVDGKIICVVAVPGSPGLVYMIKATPEKFTVLGKANLGAVECTSPAVVDGRLYMRLQKAVACFDLRKEAAQMQ